MLQRSVRLSPTERDALVRLAICRATAPGSARHARIVLFAAHGESIDAIGHLVGVRRGVVHEWISRFQRYGLGCLKVAESRQLKPVAPASGRSLFETLRQLASRRDDAAAPTASEAAAAAG